MPAIHNRTVGAPKRYRVPTTTRGTAAAKRLRRPKLNMTMKMSVMNFIFEMNLRRDYRRV